MNKLSDNKKGILAFVVGLCTAISAVMGISKCAESNCTDDKNVIVFDDFKDKHIDLNGDLIDDVSHGEFVSKMISTELPEYKVTDMSITTLTANHAAQWNQIFDAIKQGKIKYEAANLSMSFPVSFEYLSSVTGINVTRENIAEKAPEIKKIMQEHKDLFLAKVNGSDRTMGDAAYIINGLDSLSSTGTKIYVSAGNTGKNSLNVLSLVDGAIVVGASNSKGIENISCSNSMVTRYINDDVLITRTDDGYSIDRGKTTAFYDYELPDVPRKNIVKVVHGTSFSAPKALISDFKVYK